MTFECVDCGKVLSSEQVNNPFLCPCGGLLDMAHDFRGMDAERLKQLFDRRLAERMTPYAGGVWRYKELIAPELPESFITTKYEGNTGLYDSAPTAAYAGVRRLLLKAQSENPSGSFKDNGMTVAVSHGRSLGYTKFTCTSTGNTSSSLAMYAALAGCSSYVLLPDRDISMNKVLQTLAYGASLLSFRGTYDDGIRFSEEHSEALGLYVCNSVNPFRIEGQKSIIFETAHQLGWKLPDWIVLPGGALSNATALGKGLRELKQLGFIDKLPRVAVVQAEGASPFHRMVAAEAAQLVAEPQPRTRASALNIGNPPSWKKALRYTIRPTGGVTVSVSDREIMDAKAVIDRSGIGCEPASAASVAGLKKLVGEGTVGADETVVCLLTGHLLKDTDAVREYHLDSGTRGAFANAIHSAELQPEAVRKLVSEC
ncbi:Threonine synthase [Paenibacillus konkukensis]|uniref:Threonine synthase n=1 Tax=Paenibacillus konkukensis TaxID=2020716 RepID=A0ABY4RLW8_9BACL|nr:threonine synthase [Paenibacillus konkukensis]UQZ82871.1 Threonine synthase [Paenibacillus konkukensis]